jgi:hypothetical protein
MILHNIQVTGSLVLNGVDLNDVTGSEVSVAALNEFTSSQESLNTTLATTGSNQFNGSQSISGSVNIEGGTIISSSGDIVLTSNAVISTLSGDIRLQPFDDIRLYGGDGTNGGDVVLRGGNATGTNTPGDIGIYPGYNDDNTWGVTYIGNDELSRYWTFDSNTGELSLVGDLIFSDDSIQTTAFVGTATSSSFAATASFADSFTVAGEIVAQTLNVQQVTSSVVYSSGSNVFGNDISNTQQFTGSLQVSGSTHYLLGNVGIGQTTPAYKLQVSGVANSNDIVINNTTTGVNLRLQMIDNNGGIFTTGAKPLYLGTNNTANHLTIDTSGNVGIGISPSAKLDVYTTSGTLFRAEMPGVAQLNIGNGGNSTNYYDADTQIFRSGGGSERMRIDSSGNVGIGTTNPDQKLNVEGNDANAVQLKIKNNNVSNGNKYLSLFVGGTTGFSVNGWANSGVIESAAGTGSNLVLSNYEAAPIIFQTNNRNERMRITSGGDVGIGTTNPGYKLDVNGAIGSSDEIYINNGKYLRFQRSSGGLYIQTLGIESGTDNVRLVTSGDFNILNGSLTNLMTVKNGGNVGIGTTSPSEKLHIKNGTLLLDSDPGSSPGIWMPDLNGNPSLRIVTDQIDASYTSIINAWGAPNSGVTVGTTRGDGVAFQVRSEVTLSSGFATDSGTTRFIVNGNGNVGIGTTSPSQKLQVSGGDVILNNAFIGEVPTYTSANTQFSHSSRAGAGQYSFLSAIDGETFINAKSGYNIRFRENNSDKVIIQTGGNVGIGTTLPATLFHLTKASSANTVAGTPSIIISNRDSTSGTFIGGGIFNNPYRDVSESSVTSGIWFENQNSAGAGAAAKTSDIVFGNGSYSSGWNTPSEKMRITNGGFLKASNDGTYIDSTGTYHELKSAASEMISYMTNTNATPFGIEVRFSNASPNNTSSTFFIGRDSTEAKFRLYSNGGLANYQSNDVNLSDERTKKDIVSLESYWDKFKAIEIVKFKYIDQTHDDFNIGVIAQQVESVAPEFVDVDGWGETVENEEPLKSIYTADLYHATIKVLQEAMVKIEEQQEIIDSLKSRLEALEQA